MNYNKLNTVLRERKITKQKLAELSNVSDVTISKVLGGRDARISTMEAIANALGYPLSYFLDEPTQTNNTATGTQSIAGNHNAISGNQITERHPCAELEEINDRVIEKQQKLINLNTLIIEAQNQLKKINAELKEKQGE